MPETNSLGKRQCKNCGEEFIPKKDCHVFCSRRCFYQDYLKRKSEHKFPVYHCANCGTRTQLDFCPATNESKWHAFNCPGCSKNKEYDDYAIVHEIRVEERTRIRKLEIKHRAQRIIIKS